MPAEVEGLLSQSSSGRKSIPWVLNRLDEVLWEGAGMQGSYQNEYLWAYSSLLIN
jgi:hypothetical protein